MYIRDELKYKSKIILFQSVNVNMRVDVDTKIESENVQRSKYDFNEYLN